MDREMLTKDMEVIVPEDDILDAKKEKEKRVHINEIESKQNWHMWDKYQWRIYALGTLMMTIGMAIIICGVISFTLLPNFSTRQSFQLEIKWINIVTIFSGAVSIAFAWNRTLTSMCAASILNLFSSAVSVSTFIVSGINMKMRETDKEYYRLNDPQMAQTAHSLHLMDMLLCALGLLAFLLSIVLASIIQQIGGKNYGYTVFVDKKRLRLSMLGLVQVLAGLIVTGWWIGLELLSQGAQTNLREVPGSSGDVLSHGMIIIASGYMQMIAVSKGTLPTFVCATIFNACTFILSTFFATKPLSIMYFVIEHSAGTQGDSIQDARVYMCAVLVFIYASLALIAIYSLIRFVHLTAGECIARVDRTISKSRRILSTLSKTQVSLGIVYALMEIFAVSEFYLYKLDFTPLPLLIIGGGLFAYGAVQMGSVPMIIVTICISVLSGAFSLRDIYLFIYHVTWRGSTPDNPSFRVMTSFRLGFHLLIALLALCELIVSSALFVYFFMSLHNVVRFVVGQRQLYWLWRIVRTFAAVQIICSFVCLIGGVWMLGSEELFLVYFGDAAIVTGAVLLLASKMQGLCKSVSILLLPSLGTTLIGLILTWQQLDSFAFFLHSNLARMSKNGLRKSESSLIVGFFVFVAMIAYISLGLIAVIAQGSVVEQGHLELITGREDQGRRELVFMDSVMDDDIEEMTSEISAISQLHDEQE